MSANTSLRHTGEEVDKTFVRNHHYRYEVEFFLGSQSLRRQSVLVRGRGLMSIHNSWMCSTRIAFGQSAPDSQSQQNHPFVRTVQWLKKKKTTPKTPPTTIIIIISIITCGKFKDKNAQIVSFRI